MNLIIFTDGASHGNPGHSAIAYRITDGKNELEAKGEYIGITTNNEAEYRALIKALKESIKYKPEQIICYSDSNLMIHQLNGEWKIKTPQLIDYWNDIKRLEKNFKEIKYIHTRRNNPGVEKCDAIANKILNLRLTKNSDKNIYK